MQEFFYKNKVYFFISMKARRPYFGIFVFFFNLFNLKKLAIKINLYIKMISSTILTVIKNNYNEKILQFENHNKL